MAMNNRQRAKGVKQTSALVHDAQVVEYTVGRGGPQPLLTGLLILLGFAAFTVVAVAVTGQFVFPGILVFLVLQHFVNPPRAVVVCNLGVVLTDRSLFNGSPKNQVDRAGFQQIHFGEKVLGRIAVMVGTHRVWLTRKEAETLHAALSHVAGGPSGALGASALHF